MRRVGRSPAASDAAGLPGEIRSQHRGE